MFLDGGVTTVNVVLVMMRQAAYTSHSCVS